MFKNILKNFPACTVDLNAVKKVKMSFTETSSFFVGVCLGVTSHRTRTLRREGFRGGVNRWPSNVFKFLLGVLEKSLTTGYVFFPLEIP